MIVYVDASALVKRYVLEAYSAEVRTLLDQAKVVGTADISRVEVVAAISKAVRTKNISAQEATRAHDAVRADWPDLIRLKITEAVLVRAEDVAFKHPLRGYDAVHLAAAMLWQEAIEDRISIATFDKQLWTVAKSIGFEMWPGSLKTA